jgi:hypothetical protein
MKLLVDVLGYAYLPGQVCLFELISDTAPMLKENNASYT